MSRTRLLLLSMLATLTTSAIMSVSASAAPTDLCPVTGKLAICIETSPNDLVAETGGGTFSSKGDPGDTALLEIFLGESVLHIECEVVNDAGSYQQTILANAVRLFGINIIFTVCSILEPIGKKCIIKEPLETKNLIGNFADEEGESIDTVFTPESGTTFTEFQLQNNGTETCPATLTGTHRVTGEVLCLLLTAKVDTIVHLLECTSEGSRNLLFAEEPTTFLLIEEKRLSGTGTGLPWTLELA